MDATGRGIRPAAAIGVLVGGEYVVLVLLVTDLLVALVLTSPWIVLGLLRGLALLGTPAGRRARERKERV